jgi:hypothetical protein
LNSCFEYLKEKELPMIVAIYCKFFINMYSLSQSWIQFERKINTEMTEAT